MNRVYIPDDHEEIGIDPEIAEKLPDHIINIALFGIDSRSTSTTNRKTPLTGRSDTIIILSIDTELKTIKMTSILRDTWAPVKNKKGKIVKDKINAAYAYGRAQGAIWALNTNFNLNITDYVAVNMHQVAKIIDFLGGVDVNITEMERIRINELSNDNEGFNAEPLTQTGYVHLNGIQAVCYTRIRNDSEQIRAKRQQKVLGLLFEKVKKMPAAKYPEMLKKICSIMETSLSYDEIFEFSPLLDIESLHIQTNSVPNDEIMKWSDSFSGKDYTEANGAWIWRYDLDRAADYIHEWIYGGEIE